MRNLITTTADDDLTGFCATEVVTYGDPAFYARVDFGKVSQQQIHARFQLSYPNGWLAQSLTSDAIPAVPGETQ